MVFSAILLLLVVAAVVAAAVGAGAALARRGRDQYAQQGELMPGVDTGAPDSWAGAHSPEAKLHRRLAAAIRALRAQAEVGREDVFALELRVELEQHAVEVDRRLVAAAALPEGARGPAIAEVGASVAAVEAAAADLGRAIAESGASAQVRGLEDLRARITTMVDGPALPDPGQQEEGGEGPTPATG